MAHTRTGELARTTFAVIFIGLLLAVTLWVVRPFLGPGLWATMIVVSTWGLMLRVQATAGGRRWLAVTVMTVALLLLLVVPLVMAIVTIVTHTEQIADWVRLVTTWRVPDQPPRWLVELPLVGSYVARFWSQAAAMGINDLMPRVSPYAGGLTRWFVAQVGGIGFILLQFIVTVVIAAVLYGTGEQAATLARRFARRLGGRRGVETVQLAGNAISGVAIGVGVTAIVQAVLAGLGLAIAGVPFAGLLTAVMLMLCIAQLGPLLVLLPATAWVFWSGNTGWGIFLLVVAGVAGTIDNVIRPPLIRMGADLPLLLIFAGVIGGLLSFGLVGIFIGPVVLAVSYKLLESWMSDAEGRLEGWRD